MQHNTPQPYNRRERRRNVYIIVNQRLAQFKQEYGNGERSLLRFLHAAFAQTRMTVSDNNVPTQNNNCPIQNISINNYHYMS